MAYIKKLKDNELIGGTDNTDVYPVTSTEAVYNKENVSQEYINNHVDGSKIVNGTVTNNKIANGAVSMNKLDNETQTLIQRGADSSWTPMGDYDVDALYYANDLVFDPETNSSYLSLRADNMGHPVDDETWWMKVVDGSYASVVEEELQQLVDSISEGTQQQVEELNDALEALEAQADQSRQDIQDIVDSLAVVQTTGQSASDVMSQKAVTDEFERVDDYIGGDVRTLAVGQAYSKNESVKTSDNTLIRITEEVKIMNTTDTVVVGDLKAFDNNTYIALKAIAEYDEEGEYSIGDYAIKDGVVKVFDGSAWSAADEATMCEDSTLYDEVDIATLISSYTTGNSLRQDVFGIKTEDYPEFIKYGDIKINSDTKLASDSTYVSALYRLEPGKTYMLNQYIKSVANSQRAVAVLASEEDYKNNGNIKTFISVANKDTLVTGITYRPEVEEYLVLVGKSPLRQTWFKATCETYPDDRLGILEFDTNNLRESVYDPKISYRGVTPIKLLAETQIDYSGVHSKTDGITYLYKLEKGKTYNIKDINYNESYQQYVGVFELRSEENFVLGGGGIKKQWTAYQIDKTFKCLDDIYLVTGGYEGSTNSSVLGIYIVREIVNSNACEIDDTVISSYSVSSNSNSTKRHITPTGLIKENNTSGDTVYSYAVHAGNTYRIRQTASTERVLACKYHAAGIPSNLTKLDEILAVGYPSADNYTVIDYTPTEDCYILVQTNLASITKVILEDTITYLKDNSERRLVQRTDMTDVVVCGSSQTEADFQPMGFAWLERLNDILDLNFHNSGMSGYSFNENLINITDLSANIPEFLGPGGTYTYKHRQISAKYYLFNNSANGTPYGATAYTELSKAVEIAKSLGAKALFANEASNGDDKVAYTRRAFCRERNIPYVGVLEEARKCYPLQVLFPSGQTAPSGKINYTGWFFGRHLAYRSFSVYRRYIEMLERIPIWKSVKLFKVRPMYKYGSPTVADLAYDNNSQRLRFFYAISCGSLSGKNTAQMDNLDNTSYAVAGGDNTGIRTNENAALKTGGTVSFNKFALVEFILDRVKIAKGKFQINISNTPTNVYVSKVRTASSSMGYRTSWESVAFAHDGEGILTVSLNRSDYDVQLEDKVRFLIECSGEFTLSSPMFSDYDGKLKEYREENVEGYHERLYGTELNTQTGFPTSGHGWTLTGNTSVVELPTQIANYTSYNPYNSHLQLDDNSASATKTISIAEGTSQVAIRVVCCGYPKIATTRFDVDGEVPVELQSYVANDAPQIRTYEYDYGTLVLTVNDSVVKKALVWPGWAELYFEVDVPPTATSIKLKIGREFFADASYNVNSWPMFVHDVSVQKIR